MTTAPLPATPRRAPPAPATRSSGPGRCTRSTTPCSPAPPAGTAPRSLVSESWRRSLAAHVDPDRRDPPVVHRAADLDGVRVRAPARSRHAAAAQHAGEHRRRGHARHARHRRRRDDPVARGRGAACCARPTRSGSRRARAGPRTRSAPTRWAPRSPSTRRCRSTPPSTWSAPYHSWTCAAAPVHDPDTGTLIGAIDISGPLHTVHPAMVQLVVGHGAAGREPAAGAPGDRGRAAAGPQHAAPREPARPGGRAGHPDRADPGRRAVHGLAGARADRAGRATASGSTTGGRWPSSRWPRATCCTRTRPTTAPARRRALSLRFLGDHPVGAARRHARPA